MIITAKLRDEAFQDYLKRVEHSFVYMTETMIRVAEMIKDEAQLLAPWETGELSRSFRWHILADNSRMKLLHITMSALNERTGYDYAYTQHLGYRHSKSGRRVYYNHDVMNTGFYTYESDGDGGYGTNSDNVGYLHRGSSRYLYRAIVRERNSAFEMIETDYLSLFQFGGVYLGGLY